MIVGRSRVEWALLAAVLALAAALRLGAPGVIEFKRDEAALSQLALELARGNCLPLLGIGSSVGIPNAPFNVYVMALPYMFSSDPTLATQYIGLLNVLAVALTYALTRRYYGPLAALVAALAYAVSPWGVLYSRKVWAQDLLPLFVLLTIYTGAIGLVEGKHWVQWLHLPLLAITGQIHYAAFVLAPLSVYLIIIGRRHWSRSFALSVIPAVLLAVPYAFGVAPLVLANASLLAKLSSTTLALLPTLQGVEYAVLDIAGTDIHSLAGPLRFHDYLAGVPDAYPLFGLLAWAVLGACLWLLWRVWFRRDERTLIDLLLLLWIVLPVLAFSFTWTTIYPHYLIPMMPAAYIVLGVGAQAMWDRRKRPSGTERREIGASALWRYVLMISAVLFGTILVLQVWLLLALLGFLYAHATPNGFGTPFGYIAPVREAILAEHPSGVLVNLDGQNVGTDEDATIWSFLLSDVPEIRFSDAQTLVYPAQGTLTLSYCGRYQTRSDDVNLHFFDLRPTNDQANPYEGCYMLSTQGGDALTADYTPINPEGLFFDNGVRVFGYTWDGRCLRLFWEITAPTDQDYSFAVHFTDREGESPANADALSWIGRYWRPGDRVVRTFCLPEAPADITGVNIGMYTYDGTIFNNARLLDANGTPMGQMLPIRFGS